MCPLHAVAISTLTNLVADSFQGDSFGRNVIKLKSGLMSTGSIIWFVMHIQFHTEMFM